MTTKDVLIHWALAQVGKPYIWEGDGSARFFGGYDCSGFAQDFYAILGIDPPGDQTAQGYYDHWWPVVDKQCYHIAKSKVGFGDMLFFGMDRNHISHVAIALTRHVLIEAGGGGSNCTTLQKADELCARVRLRPIRLRKDFQVAIRPYHFTEQIIHQ